MKKAESAKIYRLLCGHVRIYGEKGMLKEGVISGWAYLRIMNILERELKIKKRVRRIK